jgi:hypothetical protein
MSRPLRVAMVTTFYPPNNFGGDGQYVRRLAHALVRRGHEVDVIYSADAYRLLGGVEREPLAEPKGLIVHGRVAKYLSYPASQRSNWASPLSTGDGSAKFLRTVLT